MIKNILNPGNGINYPIKGEYVKFNLLMYTSNKTLLFDSTQTKGLEIRFNSNESNLISELEDLIGEMSLFEKCSMEVELEKIKKNNECLSDIILDLLYIHKKLIFEIEILDINKNSHL